MSKMLQALKKAEDEKKVSQQEIAFGRHTWLETFQLTANTVLLVIFVAVALSSLFINIRTSNVLKKTRQATSILVRNFDGQNGEFTEIKELLRDIRLNRDVQVKALRGQIRDLKLALRKSEDDLSDIAINYNILKAVVNDVNFSNQQLMERYIALSEEIQEIKNIKQKQAKLLTLFPAAPVRKE